VPEHPACVTQAEFLCPIGEMVLKKQSEGKCIGLGKTRLACILSVGFVIGGLSSVCQSPPIAPGPPAGAEQGQRPPQVSGAESLASMAGETVSRIAIEGLPAGRLGGLVNEIVLKAGATLTQENLQASLRTIYATGLFESIQVEGSREAGGVVIVFRGRPRTFIGKVTVDGAKGATVNTQLQRATQLAAGTRYTQAKLDRALDQMRRTLADNGFNQPQIQQEVHERPEEQLIDLAFHIVSGPQSRVGSVEVAGDSGLSNDEFRRAAHLKAGSRVDRDTENKAINGVLRHYQKQERLEAEIELDSKQYAVPRNRTDYRFTANRGPAVRVTLQGASISAERLRRLIPVFEEASVDEDLLNEGNRRLRDYFQRQGYFDVKVDHEQQSATAERVVIVYDVRVGQRQRVGRVSVDGNHYFDSATLEALLSVHSANAFDRHGAYSQALVAADVSALESVYKNNGFSAVKISPETNPGQPSPETTRRAPIPLVVVYHIDEGAQQRVGGVKIEGSEHVPVAELSPLMNTAQGQLLSPQNLAGDRDALLTEFLSRGFDRVMVEVATVPEDGDPSKVDVTFRVREGQQIFVRKVLLTGLQYTRPDTVAKAITVHEGDPLSQTALLETQRNLYEFALFNEVETAVENPNGGETAKTVLIQATEARRWVFTYGLGFEAQTGRPQNNCAGIVTSGQPCNPEGKTGVSPRVLGDLTRNNLLGRDQSLSIRGTYGLLEQNINLLFQNPHFHGQAFGLTLTGGYANSQDVTTYVSSKLDVGARLTQHFTGTGWQPSKANTLIYDFDLRRVKVAEGSLQVYPAEISLLAASVRVAGPGFTWIRDTRDSPLDARRGSYVSFREFLSQQRFGAEAEFNRVDISYSSYNQFGKGRFVLARNTRYGQERAFGEKGQELIPLPERLYAGGAISLRGFSINAAGPRDPQTGFPIGGAGALINSTELRLPPPLLPWFGDTLSFVLFHDMGNVFRDASEAWPSALRVRQPGRDACKQPQPKFEEDGKTPTEPQGPNTSTGVHGLCGFDYFSHAPGLGLRYHTPVGPIRLDFSYNVNPPIYPVTWNYAHPDEPPYVGEASHFNFFFSLGQTF